MHNLHRPEITTWELLKTFGFEPDVDVYSDVSPGLSYDFGNFKLSAVQMMNMQFAHVISLSGFLVTERTFAGFSQDLPLEVESPEQAAAFLAHTLDLYSDGAFKPLREPSWLELGRRNKHTLPWERELAEFRAEQREFAARPCCFVAREWARLALKTLAAELANARTDALVILSFDGEALRLAGLASVIVTRATGQPWSCQFRIRAEALTPLPKRLMRDPVEFSIWQSRLRIDRRRYEGVAAVDASASEFDGAGGLAT